MVRWPLPCFLQERLCISRDRVVKEFNEALRGIGPPLNRCVCSTALL